ncbi:peptidoglycan glycosyltransferase [Bacillus lacus]|uniref:Peptidoglycan glycosyltransferase n=1 Tax=Metabacillus lacus TaxID=1983721 RepID=A0A7X2IZX7_9BACI|nr:transglycosylase domain-containing protein [Metabacillus lacus]MRX72734.1 peptidoglycan glycosyltransferase [Metabacillus lacus]
MKKKQEKPRNLTYNRQKWWRRLNLTFDVAWNLFLLFFIFGLIGASFAAGIGAGYFASLVKDEPIRSEQQMMQEIQNFEQTSEMYFADNVYLGKLRTDLDRQFVPLKDVSPFLTQAIIATEDELFYEHEGVVPKAVLRALFQEFSNSSSRSGGSTLTQQLIKNQILTDEVSFDRKAKEILLALRLERFFEKEEILESYLNISTFGRNSSGRNIAGVETAAQGLFGVSAKDLTLPQAAYIAGLPQSPFGYTPFTSTGAVKENLEPGLNRMKTVLNRMRNQGYITQEQHEEALTFQLAEELTDKKPSVREKYPWLTVEVEKQAKEILYQKLLQDDGYTLEEARSNEELQSQYSSRADSELRLNGYKIYTTINKGMFEKMQEAASSYQFYGSDKDQEKIDSETGEIFFVKEQVETGAVLIENRTGKILSFVGGRDFNRSETNHATLALRQNGSTMKPLLVYAPALEMGLIQPGTIIEDEEFIYKEGTKDEWRPKNSTGNFHGLVSIRESMKRSYNIPAIKTYIDVMDRDPDVLSYLRKMGFSSLDKNDVGGPSLALGAMTRGVTVEENVNAYTTFANAGKFIDAYMIEKIEAQNGDIIFEHQGTETDVFSPQTAYLTIDMMRDVISSGTAASLRLPFRSDWAGKTGTGQDLRDAWFVASNPNVTFGTWIGYDTPKPLEQVYSGLTYSQRNIRLWGNLITAAYEEKPELIAPRERFQRPEGIAERNYCSLASDVPASACEETELTSSDLFNIRHPIRSGDHD